VSYQDWSSISKTCMRGSKGAIFAVMCGNWSREERVERVERRWVEGRGWRKRVSTASCRDIKLFSIRNSRRGSSRRETSGWQTRRDRGGCELAVGGAGGGREESKLRSGRVSKDTEAAFWFLACDVTAKSHVRPLLHVLPACIGACAEIEGSWGEAWATSTFLSSFVSEPSPFWRETQNERGI